MFRAWMVLVCAVVGCAGAHAPEVDEAQPDHDSQAVDPQQDALVPAQDGGAEPPQQDAQAPDPGGDAEAPDASTLQPDAGTRDAQAPRPDASSPPATDAAPADSQVPASDAGQHDAGPQADVTPTPMDCLDVAPTDPVREMVGGAPFDCAGTAPCTGAATNASLVRAWCEADTVPIGQGFQVRWWGYATLLPEVQVPRSACVRIVASGHCTLTSSFAVTYTKWARAPQVNVQGWVEVDSSMPGALACDLSCGGMAP